MNLDDFKIQIKNQLETESSFEMPVHSISNYDAMKTVSVIDKIKSNLLFEIISGLLFVLAFLVLTMTSKSHFLSLYFGVFSIVVFGFVMVLILMYKKIKKAKFSGLNIKNNLESLHTLLSIFVKRCFQFTMLLVPLCFSSALFLFIQNMQYPSADGIIYYDILPSYKQTFLLVITIIAFTLFIYFFTKWYLNSLYGKHLSSLKNLIDLIDEV